MEKTTLILGKTLDSALEKSQSLVKEYENKGIKIINSEPTTHTLTIEFDNGEEFYITSCSYFLEPHLGRRYNVIYFDKNIKSIGNWDREMVLTHCSLFLAPYNNGMHEF